MAQITCGNCKQKHDSVPAVQACYQGKGTTTIATHFAAQDKAASDFTAMMGSLQQVADANPGISIAAGVAKVAEKTVPAHRKVASWKAPVTAVVETATPTEIQAAVKVEILNSAPKTGQDLELGMYQVVMDNGAVIVYKVKFNKAGTYKMAEKLIISQKEVWDKETQDWKTVPKGKFWYATGMMNKLTSENKMDEAAAKAFHDATKAKYGQDYGFCCVCGKLLTVKKSIDAGIGPVCAGKL